MILGKQFVQFVVSDDHAGFKAFDLRSPAGSQPSATPRLGVGSVGTTFVNVGTGL